MRETPAQRLDIEALRALAQIRAQGSLTRAAHALGLSQPAISHKIKRLEQNLGQQILARDGVQLLTRAGEELMAYGEQILALHDAALAGLVAQPLAGRLTLGFTEDTTCSELSRILGRFAKAHPQVSVRCKVRMSLVLREMLAEGTLDAAILQVFAHELRPRDVVLAREGLVWAKARGLRLGEGALPFISYSEACFYRQWGLEICQEAGVRLETVFECSSNAGVVSAVQAGMGVALISARHFGPEMERVTQLPSPPQLAYVLRRAKGARSAALDSLATEIAREAELQTGFGLAS